MSTLPLDGVRVVEFSHMVMGPSCGLILPDLGAEVVKVEPLEGDNTRRLMGAGAGFYAIFNRNKKSLALDLKGAEGHEIVLKLGGVGFPWNIWHAAWGIITNGPLEMFFFIWLTVKTGQLFKIRWIGFFGTLVLFSLVHMITAQSVVNALNIFGIFLLLGVIFQSTRNAVGPILGWTLINGMDGRTSRFLKTISMTM